MTESSGIPGADRTGRSHPGEQHGGAVDARLNWLRAGVLGANDGIVSVAGTVLGVAGATSSTFAIATAGIASLCAGAFSMAGGEYVSVSTQRDTERALIAKELHELRTMPDTELEELTGLYQQRGLSSSTARLVAEELTAHDALHAHAEVELGIDPDAYTNPWAAALSSLIAFTIGAALPLIVIFLPLGGRGEIATVAAVAGGLLLTGYVSARLGGAPPLRAVLRNVGMGLLTMLVTYLIGRLFGTIVGG
ncbi:MAG: VIT family protein [Pseudoclavibacter sp.]